VDGMFTPNPNDIVTLDEAVNMRVLWTINGYVLGKDAKLDEQAAKAMLFKPLDITSTEIIFAGKACQKVIFQVETVKAADYLAQVWQTTPAALAVTDETVQVFKTNCALPGFQEYVRLSDSRLIVQMDGVFFIFEPNVAN
jgi:hypothetical protein